MRRRHPPLSAKWTMLLFLATVISMPYVPSALHSTLCLDGPCAAAVLAGSPPSAGSTVVGERSIFLPQSQRNLMLFWSFSMPFHVKKRSLLNTT